MTTSHHNQQVQTAPVVSRLQKFTSALAMGTRTAAAYLTGSKIIGKTTDATLLQAEIEAKQDYRKNADYFVIRELEPTGEGQVSFVGYCKTNIIVVRKAVRPRKLQEDNRCEWDRGKWKYPNEAFIARFMKPHPNIVNIFSCNLDMDIDAPPGQYEIFMECCRGGNLDDQIVNFMDKNHKVVPESFILHATIQLLEAMAFIHNGLRYCVNGMYTQDPDYKAIVHADIKPENIFLKWSTSHRTNDLPTLVLGDFGGAKFSGGPQHLVHLGTEEYRAPEDLAILGDIEIPCQPDEYPTLVKLAKERAMPSDIYAIALIIEQLVRCDLEPLPIGHDFLKVELSEEYKEPLSAKNHIRLMLYSMLTQDPKDRGTADFDSRTGLLEDVHFLRLKRQDMIMAGTWGVDERLWKCRPRRAVEENIE